MTARELASVPDAIEISDATRLVEQPVVSVLMLAYNHADYIEQAIACVLAQQTTYPFELLVGEDCSTDLTREIVMRFQREAPERLRVIVSDGNVGMHANHGRLVAKARGEFIAYCEGDDYWLDADKLQKQVEFMRQNPSCGLVHGNYHNLIAVGGAWRTRLAFRTSRRLEHRMGRIYPAMLQANRIQTCTALSRRQLVDRYRSLGPGVDAYRVCDWPEFLYIAHESEIGFINEPLAAYRRTPGSVTNSGDAAAVERVLDAIRMVEDFCTHFHDDHEVRVSALGSQFRMLMLLAFRAGDQLRFEQARIWLALNKPDALRSTRVRLMCAVVRWPKLCALIMKLLPRVESVAHRFTFRKLKSGAIYE